MQPDTRYEGRFLVAYYWKYFPACLISKTEQAVGSRPNQIMLTCRAEKKRSNVFCLSAMPSLVKSEDKMASGVAKGTTEIKG